MVVLTKTLRWREVLSLGVPMFSLSLTHPGQVDDRKLTVNVSLLGLWASITVNLSLVLGCYKCINLWIGHLMDLGTALWDGFPTNPIAYFTQLSRKYLPLLLGHLRFTVIHTLKE